jgi:hypothetical protein
MMDEGEEVFMQGGDHLFPLAQFSAKSSGVLRIKPTYMTRIPGNISTIQTVAFESTDKGWQQV